jgi:glycosyltransferase involved in cell wall biosynthesis
MKLEFHVRNWLFQIVFENIKMRVLHINQSDLAGGACIASYRLQNAMVQQGIHAELLVDKALSTNNSLTHLIGRRRLIEALIERFNHRLGLNYISIGSSFSISRSELYQAANILNFHNLHGGYFNYLAIPKLTKTKPAIFTLHDMWSFTGHCAYSFECNRWETGCGKCPHLNVYPEVPRDNTALEWKLKNWVYRRSNLVVVTPSNWLKEQVVKSMMSHLPVHHIPNGLDLNVYRPLNSKLGRDAFGLPNEKFIVLVAAQSLKDSRKGSDLLVDALRILPPKIKANIVVLVMGKASEILLKEIEMPIVPLGYVGGDRLKALAYSAADICVFPTRADNLPLVVQESLACGTPVVSFDVAGVPEMVRPGITGLLAEPENSGELAAQISQILTDDVLRERMSHQSREIALAEYSIDLQVKRYISLYEQTIGTSG